MTRNEAAKIIANEMPWIKEDMGLLWCKIWERLGMIKFENNANDAALACLADKFGTDHAFLVIKKLMESNFEVVRK